MCKYSKVYLRNKKQSNISHLLRYSFLRSIFADNMTVKSAAIKWKIHYSSAKIIAREAKKTNLPHLFQQTSHTKQLLPCAWTTLPEDKKQDSKLSGEKEGILGESTDSSMGQDGGHQYLPSKIQIVSTIGWNFMSVLREKQNQ